MGRKQTVIWTTLPQSAEENQLQLSVFVSPRLEPDEPARLGAFQDFVMWTETVHRIGFKVEFEGGKTFAPEEVGRVGPPLLPELWEALFDRDTNVLPYDFDDYSNRDVVSYPVLDTLSFIRQQYQKLGTQSGINLPLTSFLLGDTDASGNPNGEDRPTSFATLAPRDKSADMRPSNAQNIFLVFQQVKKFHQPLRNEPVSLPRPDFFERKIDFHQMVSALGDYGPLLCRLGLVIKLRVSQEGVPKSGFVRVVPAWSPQGPESMDFSPWTAYGIDGDLFAAKSPKDVPSDIQGGLLRLDEDPFALVQVDVDGAAIKAVNFAESLIGMAAGQALGTPSKAGAPTIRSGGISVVRTGRKEAFQKAVKKPGEYQSALLAKREGSAAGELETKLFADDLVRGYRIDVLDESTAHPSWHSLCKRVGNYFFMKHDRKDGALLPGEPESDPLKTNPWIVHDEGLVQMATTSAADGSSPALRLHESLFHWDGWSLCAPRPGKHVDNAGKAAHYDDPLDPFKPEDNELKATSGFKLVTAFKAENRSLPLLRFGHEYHVRARTVDLAGHSLAAETSGEDGSTPKLQYRRFEPVAAPVVVLDKEHKPEEYPGESLEHIVIRSNYNKSIEQYAAGFKKISPDYHAAAMRLIAPPKITQLFAEMHGKFDDPARRAEFFEVIMKKEAGIFRTAKKPDAEPTRENMKQALDPIALEHPLKLPYLPDPLSRGATLCLLPGAEGLIGKQSAEEESLEYSPLDLPVDLTELRTLESVVQISFGPNENWPDLKPFFIRLVDEYAELVSSGDHIRHHRIKNPRPAWDPEKRILTVCLGKARKATIRLSSSFDADEGTAARELELMGIWNWITETDTDTTLLKSLVLLGLHWMITPYREITLVHAVQQPLKAPVLAGKSVQLKEADKYLGQTFALLDCEVKVDAKSTSKFDILARWDDPVDPLDNKEWEILHGQAHVFESPVNLGQNTLEFQYILRKPEDEGRFEELDNRIRHEFGDTRYRRVSYRSVATSRFREYFEFTPPPGSKPDNATRLDFTQEGEEVVVEVRNSAPPAAPKVLYVVPLFGWERSAPNAEPVSRKRKGGLRVYLERPWFSSGADERLGVILFGENDPHELERFKPYITQWGNDPVWGAHDVPAVLPRRRHFTSRIIDEDEAELPFEEMSASRVSVASHKVEYDAGRSLWYCDIEVDAGKAYFPFIRLALARFQPHSVPGVHLSRIVLADFAQIVPNRSVTVTRKSHSSFLQNDLIHVTVNGTTYQSIRKPSGDEAQTGSTVEVIIEQLDPTFRGELNWVEYGAPIQGTVVHGPTSNHPTLLWEGSFSLPQKDGDEPPRRLVVKEWESWFDDKIHLTNEAGSSQGIWPPPNKRLVFADVIPLDEARWREIARR